MLTRPPSPGERSRCRRPRRSHRATRHRRSPSRVRSDVICDPRDPDPTPRRRRRVLARAPRCALPGGCRRWLDRGVWDRRYGRFGRRWVRRATPTIARLIRSMIKCRIHEIDRPRILAAARARGGADDTKASGRGFKGRRSHPPAASSRTYGRREPGSREPPPSPLGPAHQPLLRDRPVLPLVLRRASPPPRRHRSPWR